MGGKDKTVVKVLPAISQVAAAEWDSVANPDAARHNPFVSHAFLNALEAAGTTAGRSGWHPQHLVIEDAGGRLRAAMPLYLKTHSQGEYVFDHAWADASHRAGIPYYPKLQCAVPFTPVPGPRFLVRPGADANASRGLLAEASMQLAERLEASSVHLTFLTTEDWHAAGELGFLQRTGLQFHWHNAAYATFDDFLASLASRKRKMIRKERAEAMRHGVEIELLTGRDITEAHWDAIYSFYIDTGSRKWGRPYLNRAFFSHLGAAMSERCLIVLAQRAGQPVAGALNLIGGDCLYGRYWGAKEPLPCLHFEICYYQAIDYAIRNGLARVEAGAQGEHKLARGYLAETTYSAHWIADPRLRDAVARFLDVERREIEAGRGYLREAGPFRKSEDGGEP